MNETNINWTEWTWNPASGCKVVSAGCQNCYAETLAEQKRGTKAFPVGFELTLREHKLGEPIARRKPSLIFTSSMTDVFFEEIPDAYRHQIFDAIEASPRHRFQVLTKRPHLARAWFKSRPCPPNVWIGATVEDGGVRAVAERLDHLRAIDARVRFVSAEPLLGRVDHLDLSGVHWVIAGGESGTHLARGEHVERRALVERDGSRWRVRADRADWVRALRDRCQAEGRAFWFKQWGGTRPDSAGRELDGRTWDEFPTVPGAMPEGYVHKRHLAVA